MKLNNISLPYPVLGINDDIIPGLSDDSIKMELISKSVSEFTFKLELKFDNPQIAEYIKQGYANYVCEVDCRATLQRYSITSSEPVIEIKIPRKEVAGEIVFNSYVTVFKPIKGYVNKGFNADYAGCSFDMEIGDILVGFPTSKYDTDLKYDKLQAAGSYMQIREEKNKDYTNIDLSGKTIDVMLPTKLFKMYNEGVGQSFPEVMHASIAYSALVTALYELKANYNDYRDKIWAKSIIYRLETEDIFKDFVKVTDDSVSVTDVSSVASLLLKDPYNRMFNSLSALKDNESMIEQ